MGYPGKWQDDTHRRRQKITIAAGSVTFGVYPHTFNQVNAQNVELRKILGSLQVAKVVLQQFLCIT